MNAQQHLDQLAAERERAERGADFTDSARLLGGGILLVMLVVVVLVGRYLYGGA